MRVLEPFRPCFTTPTFETFVTLVAGMIARPGQRTVCGMLAGAGLVRAWHHSRAHRFFAAARWDTDTVGLTVLRLIVGFLVPVGAPLLVAVDDTMFRRCGRRVYAAHWGYDGSLKVPRGGKRLPRGNCFVVAAVVVELPFHLVPPGRASPRGDPRTPRPRALVHHQDLPSYTDMIARLRRILIAAQYLPDLAHQPHPRRNPRRPAGLGTGSGVTAKVEQPSLGATISTDVR